VAGDTRYPCLAVAVRSLAPPALVYYQLCGKFRWHGGHNCCISNDTSLMLGGALACAACLAPHVSRGVVPLPPQPHERS
jgi:hypothetical protein